MNEHLQARIGASGPIRTSQERNADMPFFDLFISYRRLDAPRVRPLVA